MSDSQQEESRDSGQFFQKPKFDAFERLICSHLIEASKNEPLLTVIHITRAALAVNDETRKRLGIDKAQMLSLYTVAQRLATAIPFKNPGDTPKYSVNLSTVDFDADVQPWIKMTAYEGSASHYSDIWNKFESLKDKKDPEGVFHLSNKILTVAGYNHLVSDFLLYAIPIIEDTTRLLTSLVSPETYTELIKLYHGEKPE